MFGRCFADSEIVHKFTKVPEGKDRCTTQMSHHISWDTKSIGLHATLDWSQLWVSQLKPIATYKRGVFEHSLSYDVKEKLFVLSTLGDKDEKTDDIHGCRVFLDSTLSRQMFLGLPFSHQWVSLHRLGEKSHGKVNLLFGN